ncbi:ABC transporter permease [Chromatiales bacterium (ex Bugula neritina AB1)]|nr:ABC transporter permease [Chromatiales bacterium (ex Bugula neritina AB1)]
MVSQLTITPVLCLLVLTAVLVVVLFAPLIAPHPEAAILTDESFSLPDDVMLLGSDFLGRDVLSRLLYGARITLSVAFAISIVAFLLGCSFGFFAAVKRGWIDSVLSRSVDALISFPAIMVALIVISALGSSITVLIVTIALIDSTRVYRVARALGMDIVVQDYIEAARVRGEKITWIIWHEMLPNALAPLAAEFGIRFTYAILFISALSFLGLGVQAPHADLGVMVKENMQGLLYETYTPLYPAVCIAIVTLSVNLLVDWFLKTTDAALPDEL